MRVFPRVLVGLLFCHAIQDSVRKSTSTEMCLTSNGSFIWFPGVARVPFVPREGVLSSLWSYLSASFTLSCSGFLHTHTHTDTDTHTQARVTSCSSKNAGAWLTALPSSEHGWTLSDEEFLVAARIRMGLPPHDRLPRICSCGVSRDDMPSHCLFCIPPAGASVTYRHDLVKNVLAYWARIAGAAVEIEPRNLFPGSNMRPDLLVHLGCTRYLIDNVISHPLAPSHVARAQRSLGTAAYAETRKRRAYGQLCAGIGASFVPFSCESFGAIGECASTFI